jgi:3-hydroxybutyryl-CoA dehydratase
LTDTLHFEDLSVGQFWRSPNRVITPADVGQFAFLTGDHTPLHSGDQFGASDDCLFGRPVVHGLLGLSILAGLSSEHPKVKTLALIGLREIEFLQPIYFDEVVFAETEVVSLTPYGRRAGRVIWQRRLMGQRSQVFQQGTLETLVAARQPLPRVSKLNPLRTDTMSVRP